MDRLYAALKARGIAQDTTSRIKYWGKWNNDLERMRNGKALGFRLPAVLFQFQSPNEIVNAGGGVQIFDPLNIIVHVLHEFYNDADTGTAINLDVYDLGRDVQSWFQGFSVQGADYGSGPLNRTQVIDDDEDWEKVYHYQPVYTTTWTDNSQSYPVGGSYISPPHEAAITAERLDADVPAITVNPGSLDFGSTAIGTPVTKTFTIAGVYLDDDEPLIISTDNGLFLITFETNYKTRLALMPTDGTIDETTVTVKYTPTSGGGSTGSILYSSSGESGEITLTGSAVSNLLQETGDALLQESGDNILL